MTVDLQEKLRRALSDAAECDQRRCPIARCICNEQAMRVIERFDFVAPKPKKRTTDPVRTWTPEEESKLREMHGDRSITYREMAAHFGTTFGAVRGQLRRMKVARRHDWGPGQKLHRTQESA